jgi:putative ABC transport system permease protein
MLFFAVCLAVGVAAVVAVAGLSSALDRTIRAQARQLLAADLAVESRRPIPPAVLDAIDALPGVRRTPVVELATMVSTPAADGSGPGPSLLCELKAVGEGYPWYGALELDPDRPLAELLADDRVVVGPELLSRLGLAPGDDLVIGGERFTIAGVVTAEPDRIAVSFSLGPRVLLSTDGLARTGLIGLGSRVSYRTLVRLPGDAGPDALAAAATAVRAAISEPEFVELETAAEARPAIRRGVDRVGRFLGLVALLSLVIGGIGVAQAVRAWLAGRLDAIAALRSLGMRPREVFGLYLGQTAVLALVGSVAGAVVGALVARATPVLLTGLLPVDVTVGWQPTAMLRGVALGLVVALLFGLRPLVDAMRVPPIRVLRRDAEPLPIGRLLAASLATLVVVGIGATAAVQSGSLVRGLQFAGGLTVAAVVLAGSAWLVVRSVARAPRERGPLILRHGLAALARPGSGTVGAVVALGLGVVTVLGMFLVQDRVSAELDADLPDDAPTVFLIDVQPDQWDGVRDLLVGAGAGGLDSVEVVMARLAAVDGVPVAELAREASGEAGDRRWVLTREQRLTSMTTLPDDNEVVAGALWSHPGRAEVSIERDFADDLGVGIGDTLTFDVQGVPIELLVSSLRTVDWERFSINFFLVVEPGVLDRAPRFRIAAARLEAAAEPPVQNRLAASYPNVTMLRLRDVLDRVVGVLEQLGNGVRMLGGFTVLAGIAILAGAVSASAARRSRQAALFKTLGMTRAQVAAVFAVEYALVGLVSGVLGVVGATAMAWMIVHVGFELGWAWRPDAAGAALGATVALSVVAGLAASTRALAVRPLVVLRRAD